MTTCRATLYCLRSACRLAVPAAAAMLVWGTPTLACPVCDAGTGQAVRDGLFDDNIGPNLLAVLAPFPVMLAVVAFIHFGGRRPRPRCREMMPERP